MLSDKRPKLTRSVSEDEFMRFYWLKSELQLFCREQGLSPSGSKFEILDRIQCFLRTGSSPIESAKPKIKKQNSVMPKWFQLSDLLPQGFKCSREMRNFFVEQVGESFHFSVALQQYIKSTPALTFQGVIDHWKYLNEQKKTGLFKTEIGPQFEYNQFTRDFFSDPVNQGKTQKDCIDAWSRIKLRPGSRKYQSGAG